MTTKSHQRSCPTIPTSRIAATVSASFVKGGTAGAQLAARTDFSVPGTDELECREVLNAWLRVLPVPASLPLPCARWSPRSIERARASLPTGVSIDFYAATESASSRPVSRTATAGSGHYCGPAWTIPPCSRSGRTGLRWPPRPVGRRRPAPQGRHRPQTARTTLLPGPAQALGSRADLRLDLHVTRPRQRLRTQTAHAETMIHWAMTDVILRRLTRGGPATRPGPKPLRRVF